MKTPFSYQILSQIILKHVKKCRSYSQKQIKKQVLSKYWYWRTINENKYIKKKIFQRESERLPLQPEFTIITHIGKGENLQYFSETIRSVLSQFYQHWKWYIICEQNLIQVISILIPEKQKNHIKIIATTNKEEVKQLFTNAPEKYSGFLSANDSLAPIALLEIVLKINKNPSFDLFFSDEDHLKGKNQRYDPWFKPEFNLYNLRSSNYLNHFLVVRETLLKESQWFESLFSESNTNYYDLTFQLTEKKPNICHIPAVLYHSRSPRLFVPNNHEDYSLDPKDLLALKNHLSRMRVKARVLPNNYPGTFQIHYEVYGTPKVSIIIPNKDQTAVLSRCIESILKKTTYPNFEILIVENNSESPEIFTYYDHLNSTPNFPGQVLYWKSPFNYAAINNWATKQSDGEYLLFLNNDTEIITPSWIEEMLGIAQQLDVGAVGTKLTFPNGNLQHAGGGYGQFRQKFFFHLAEGIDGNSPGYYGFTRKINSFLMVTGACLMVNKNKFEIVSGFDEDYPFAFNDVDLCLKLYSHGWNNIFTPYAELIHHESITRGYDITKEQQRQATHKFRKLQEKWKKLLVQGDPFISHHLQFEHYAEEYIK